MSQRNINPEAIMSWTLALAVLLGVTLCLRVVTAQANATTLAGGNSLASSEHLAQR